MRILRTAILEMLRQKKTQPFFPQEVLQQMYPEDWIHFMPDILEEMVEMRKERLISLVENHTEISLEAEPSKLTMITKVKK